MPEPGNKVQFKNYHRQMTVPFVIYADFEAITEEVQGCQPKDAKSYTNKCQKHTGCSYGFKVVCCYNDKYSKPVQIYRVEDAIEKFMQEMLKEEKYCMEIIKSKFNKPLRMSQDEEEMFREEPYMWKAICGKICQSLRPLPYYGKIEGLCTSRLQSEATQRSQKL